MPVLQQATFYAMAPEADTARETVSAPFVVNLTVSIPEGHHSQAGGLLGKRVPTAGTLPRLFRLCLPRIP